MSTELKIQKALEERIARAASRGFTREYQEEREHRGNTISHRALAPVTLQKYEEAALNWALWRLSRNEATDANFSKDEPDPTPQQLKLFAEFVITSSKTFPSQQTACHKLTIFTSKWERETSRSLRIQVTIWIFNESYNSTGLYLC
ncbi:hypothetical protein PENDEC_c030G03960 [Penicillium decumbens]|uniref:Uncharacterized protein n=1 Tax=Penicillium decumbens TaxID=69771 RepID=A0A1V6NW08_PENDC|nr:hypothetical protein PENDEC_c030G03960 [Penicillium decumbens]